MDSTLVDSIKEYRKRLEKGVGVDKTLHILRKLDRIQFSVEMLKETGIGKVVRKLSKENDGDVRDRAKHLCSEWRRMVREVPEVEADVKQNDVQSPKKVKVEKEESTKKVKSENGYKNSCARDPELSWSSKPSSKHVPQDSSDDEKPMFKNEYWPSKPSFKHVTRQIEDSSDDEKPFYKNEKFSLKQSSKLMTRKTQDSSDEEKPMYKPEKWSSKPSSKPITMKTQDSSDDEKPLSKPDLWSSKPSSKPIPLKTYDSSDDEKTLSKPDRRLPTMKEVQQAQRLTGSRNVTDTNSESNKMLGFTSRKVRTTVYSGTARSTKYTHVLRLEDLCLRVLMDHIDKITYLGCVPYFIVKPVLKKCTPTQLFRIEDYNPSFVEDDDELWFEHCQSNFKDSTPDEHESWRELYIRCEYERDAKLKKISGKINRQQEQLGPARKTMLFDTNIVKAPRNIQRLQQKLGTAAAVHFPERGATGKVNAAAMRAAARESTSSRGGGPPKKAKTAPLMAKSIQLMKTRFRR